MIEDNNDSVFCGHCSFACLGILQACMFLGLWSASLAKAQAHDSQAALFFLLILFCDLNDSRVGFGNISLSLQFCSWSIIVCSELPFCMLRWNSCFVKAMQTNQLRQLQIYWVDTPTQLPAAPCGFFCYLLLNRGVNSFESVGWCCFWLIFYRQKFPWFYSRRDRTGFVQNRLQDRIPPTTAVCTAYCLS